MILTIIFKVIIIKQEIYYGVKQMKDFKLKGIIPAFITPFDNDGNLNTEAAKQHAKNLAADGANGLYVGGSSGEMALLSVDERKKLLESVIEAVPDMPLIVHIGAISALDAVELAKHAESCNVAAISSVTPFYYKYSFDEIKGYYEMISDAVDTPMVIYNIPNLSGSNLSMDQLCSLMEIKGVAGMKFTSSDYFAFERIRRAFPDKILYNGADEMLMSGLAMGADGGIGTNYNFICHKMVRVYEKFNSGDIAGALEEQHKINDIVQILFRYKYLPAVKTMIKLKGLDCGNCRPPFGRLTDKEIEELKNDCLPLILK